jgi:hypothetical protein
MKQPVNVFARIESNLDELEKVGKRILIDGAEMVRFSLFNPSWPSWAVKGFFTLNNAGHRQYG